MIYTTNAIEQAIDALVDEFPGRLTVVVAAGNAARPRNDSDGALRPCHAKVRLDPAGRADDQATLTRRAPCFAV